MGQKVGIIGIGQTKHVFMRPDVNQEELINEAVRLALDDAGLSIHDIDTVIIDDMEMFQAHYLSDCMVVDGAGMYRKPGLKMNTGGTSGATAVVTGWHHVASGVFGTALVVGWQKQDATASISSLICSREPFYDRGWAGGAVGIFAAMGQKYMEQTGCTEEHAAIARVIMADNARRNPYAHVKPNLTVDDVLKSRTIVWPVRLLHMSPTSCGACALVLGNEERSKKAAKRPVWIRDVETAHREVSVFRGGCVEPLETPSAIEVAAARIYKRNGITKPARDIDVWEIYTPSSWALFPFMELFSICEKGEAWKLVEKGVTRIEGDIPIEPSGGVVSTNPIGASGVIRVAEAAIQLRGEGGERQVTKKAETAIATAWGSASWIVVLYLTKHS
jgi:acetyl-CoA C-acetyltransferase